MFQLLDTRRRFAPRPPVDAGHAVGAHPLRDAQRIHRRVARAHHRDPLAEPHRRVVQRLLVAAHQVDTRQEFVGGEHAVQRLSRNSGEFGRAGAGPYECAVIAHFAQQLRNGEQLADDGVKPDLDAQLLQVFDFGVDNYVGQA